LNLAEYARVGRTFTTAEIAQARDGSLGILHSLVDAVPATAVDAIKFQVHIDDAAGARQRVCRIAMHDPLSDGGGGCGARLARPLPGALPLPGDFLNSTRHCTVESS